MPGGGTGKPIKPYLIELLDKIGNETIGNLEEMESELYRLLEEIDEDGCEKEQTET